MARARKTRASALPPPPSRSGRASNRGYRLPPPRGAVDAESEALSQLFRAMLYFARGESGGIVVGARVPLVLRSRAETPVTKLRSIAIGMLVAAQQRAAAA